MKPKKIAIVIIIILGFVTSAFGDISLGEVLDNPALNDIFASEYGYVAIEPDYEEIAVSIIDESGFFTNKNKLGIFSYADPTVILELFSGQDSAGDSVTVHFDTANNQAWVNELNKVSIGSTFGFYLDSTDRFFRKDMYYSDSSLNKDDKYKTHALLFETSSVLGIEGNPDVITAFEDWPTRRKFPGDFDDMVIGVTNVTIVSGAGPVPEPATIVLLGLGCLAIFGYKH